RPLALRAPPRRRPFGDHALRDCLCDRSRLGGPFRRGHGRPGARARAAGLGRRSPPARLDLAPSRLRPRASRARVASPLASSDPRSGETSVSPERVCDSHVNARGGDDAPTVGNARDDRCLRPGEREIQLEREHPAEMVGLPKPEIGGVRISGFFVGSANYNSRIQMVPEFAGNAGVSSEPRSLDFRFDQFTIGAYKTFSPWL